MTKRPYFLLELWWKFEGFEELCFLVLESPILIRGGSLEEVGISHLDESGVEAQSKIGFGTRSSVYNLSINPLYRQSSLYVE
jgi:hypothetical protein